MNIDFQDKSGDLRTVLDWLSTAAAELLSRAEKSEHELAECRGKLADFEKEEERHSAAVRYIAQLRDELEAKKEELSERERAVADSEKTAADKLNELEQQKKDNETTLENERKSLTADFADKKNKLEENYQSREEKLEEDYQTRKNKLEDELKRRQLELETKYYTEAEKSKIDAETAKIKERDRVLKEENNTQRETIESLMAKMKNQPESENTADVQKLEKEIERLNGIIQDQKGIIKNLQLQNSECPANEPDGETIGGESFDEALRRKRGKETD